MNSYEQLIDRFDTFQKGMDGFGTVAGAYKDEILSAYKDEKSPAPKDEEVHDHAQDKETVAKLQEIILAIKDMELRLNQTIMNSQKVVVSQPQVSVPVAAPVVPQPAPQNHMEETPVEPEISPEPEESMEPEPEISPDLEENRNRKFCRIWRRAWNRRFRWSRKKIWNRRFCRIYRKRRI